MRIPSETDEPEEIIEIKSKEGNQISEDINRRPTEWLRKVNTVRYVLRSVC